MPCTNTSQSRSPSLAAFGTLHDPSDAPHPPSRARLEVELVPSFLERGPGGCSGWVDDPVEMSLCDPGTCELAVRSATVRLYKGEQLRAILLGLHAETASEEVSLLEVLAGVLDYYAHLPMTFVSGLDQDLLRKRLELYRLSKPTEEPKPESQVRRLPNGTLLAPRIVRMRSLSNAF